MKNKVIYVLVILIVYILLGCKKRDKDIPYIRQYINNPTLKEPTLKDYHDIGIYSVNKYNLKKVNKELRQLHNKNQYF